MCKNAQKKLTRESRRNAVDKGGVTNFKAGYTTLRKRTKKIVKWEVPNESKKGDRYIV